MHKLNRIDVALLKAYTKALKQAQFAVGVEKVNCLLNIEQYAEELKQRGMDDAIISYFNLEV